MPNSSELVIGIVRPVGADAGVVFECLENGLKQFLYKTAIIKVSQLVLGQFTDEEEPADECERINHYMDLGDEVRARSGDSAILMKGVAAYIHQRFRKSGDESAGRIAYIIDSIKHPDEVDFLRKTYGDGFHLLGVSDRYENRLKYLSSERGKGISEEDAKSLLERDEHESYEWGQQTRDAFQESDYFIKAGANRDKTYADVSRLLNLLFGYAFETPTFEEYAMFRAYVASLRSADLSRQVGAVVTRGDEILSEGVNDCPKTGGGLYWPFYDAEGKYTDKENGRDYTLGFDPNKYAQDQMISRIIEALGLTNNQETAATLKKAGIGALTEYGRVVHAEMEALLMCARNGVSVRGCEMYVTTFPCHNCAKHIIAAGITRVTYIEPYTKSRTWELYPEEVTPDEDCCDGRVRFVPFYGVGPHRFVDLFSMRSTKWEARRRKDEQGKRMEWDRKAASLRNPLSPLSYIAIEKAACMEYIEAVKELRGGAHAGPAHSR